MAHSFELVIYTDINTTLTKVKHEVENAGGVFKGDAQSGSFAGNGIEGSYQIDRNVVSITITKKPFIIPKSLIEEKIKGYFS